MKTATRYPALSSDEALLLQQVHEAGENSLSDLSRDLGMGKRRIQSLLLSLRQKGLVKISSTFDDLWVLPSTKGQRLVGFLWPEAVVYYS